MVPKPELLKVYLVCFRRRIYECIFPCLRYYALHFCIDYYAIDGNGCTSCSKNAARRGKWSKENRSEEHTSELQSRPHLVCRLLLEKKKQPAQIARWTAR